MNVALVVPVSPSATIASFTETVGVDSLSSTDTLSEFWLATARSGSESLLKSPTVTEAGKSPTPKLVVAEKLPPGQRPGTPPLPSSQ